MNYYGSIDLTKLGEIIKQHPECVKTVQFQNGEIHKYIQIDVREKAQKDMYNNVAYIKVPVHLNQQKEGVNYYISDLKESQFNNTNAQTPVIPSNSGAEALKTAFGIELSKPSAEAGREKNNGQQNDLPF